MRAVVAGSQGLRIQAAVAGRLINRGFFGKAVLEVG